MSGNLNKPSISILLIEDDEDDYLLTCDLLGDATHTEYQIEWAASYEAGLEACQNGDYSIALVDYRLGALTGLDFLKEIRHLGSKIPVILLTGASNPKLDFEALQAGAMDFLSKIELTTSNLDRAIRYGIRHTEALESVARMADFDALTNLASRNLFNDRLQQSIFRAERTQTSVAVLLIDLDNFKDINDTLGHPMGDLLLKEVANALTNCARKSDTIARLGGDEFAVIAPDTPSEDGAVHLATKIVDVLSACFQINGHEVHAGASVGVALYPADGLNPETLLKNADLALYQAKESGRGNCQLFRKELHAEVVARNSIANDLRRALANDELTLHYQPQINLENGHIVGIESLIRWNHPVKGMISPEVFIPVAESRGLISPITDWVLETACAQNKAWQEAGLPKVKIAVNVSSIDMRRRDFLDTVVRILESSKLEPKYLEIEITENTILPSEDVIASRLQALQSIGVFIAIDDFGTGYSSLGHLKRYPVDKIKIDRSFVLDIEYDDDSRAIAEAIIGLGRGLGVTVVAEGVERPEQLRILKKNGCDEAQGYLFGRPMAAERFPAWLGDNSFQKVCYLVEKKSYPPPPSSSRNRASSEAPSLSMYSRQPWPLLTGSRHRSPAPKHQPLSTQARAVGRANTASNQRLK